MNNKKYIAALLMILLGFSISAGYCDENPNNIKERYNVYYNNGVNLYKEKKYTAAINEFKKVLRYVPYDKNVQNALYTAYISRAGYFLDIEKQPKKSINDIKSALFYMKYWSETTAPEAQKAETTLNQLQKKYENMNADTKFQHAKALRAEGQMAAAGYDLNVLKSNPKYAFSSLLTLSDIYKSLNNQQMALECIRLSVKTKPEDGLAHYKYALILDDIGNSAAADDEYSAAFKNANNDVLESLKNLWLARSANNPKNANALINLGAIYQKQKQYDLAREQYLKAQSLNPKDTVALLNLASLCFETKDYRGAIENYKKVLSIEPNNGAAKDGIKLVTSNLTGDDLITFLKEDAINNPYDYDKQFNYAFELHKNKNYPEAITYYKKAIAINGKAPEPYINIAQIYRAQGDIAKANAAISHGLSSVPNNKDLLSMKNDIETEVAGSLYNTAVNYFNAGDYKTALDNYLKIKIQTPEVLYSIASCYFELNENERAIEYFKRVLEKTPKDTKAMYFIANSYVNLQNTQSASEYLNKILAIEPNNQEAKTALASLKQGEEGKYLDMAISSYENKKYDESLSLLNKVIAINPKSAYALYYKGAVFDDTGKKDAAIEEYKKAINADPNFSLAYYMLAVVLDNKEQYAPAVGYYEKYLLLKTKEGSEDDSTNYVKNRIKELKDYLEQK